MKRLGCVLSLMMAGCAGAQAAEASGSLAAPVVIASDASSDGRVDFTIAGGQAAATALTLPIAAPTLRLRSSGDGAELDALVLPLGDVDVPATALPPTGLKLRQLVLTAEPTRATVLQAEPDALTLRATVPLTLHWSLQLDDGALYPLGTLATPPLAVDVELARAGAATTATVRATCAGTCWALAGVARLSDGAVYLQAPAEVTATP